MVAHKRKEEAIKYMLENPKETTVEIAKNLDIATSTLARWSRQVRPRYSPAADHAINKIAEHTHSIANKVTVCEQCSYLRKKLAELEETNMQIKKTLKSVL